MWFRHRMDHPSIATRLFLSAARVEHRDPARRRLLLSAIYRRTAEEAFDQQLGVYLRALVAELAAPGDEKATVGEGFGEPKFELRTVGLVLADHAARRRRSARSRRRARCLRRGCRASPIEASAPASAARDRAMRSVRTTGACASSSASSTPAIPAFISCRSRRQREEIEDRDRAFQLALGGDFRGAGALARRRHGAAGALWPATPAPVAEQVASIRRGQSEKIVGEFPRRPAPLAARSICCIVSNREIVERARTQVGNLAHALKTPLSVIINEARDGGLAARRKSLRAGRDHGRSGDLLSRSRARGRSFGRDRLGHRREARDRRPRAHFREDQSAIATLPLRPRFPISCAFAASARISRK